MWNNGDAAPGVEPGSAPLDASFPTNNLLIGCTPTQQRIVWSNMLTQKLTATSWAGITFVGSTSIGDAAAPITWAGANMNQAQAINCNATPFGAGVCPSGNGVCYNGAWGYNNEVGLSWNTQTNLIDQMTINIGYTGPFELVFKTDTADGQFHVGDIVDFVMGKVPTIIPKGAGAPQPMEVPWGTADTTPFLQDLYIGAMDTFATSIGVPWVPNSDAAKNHACNAAGECLILPNSGGASYFGIRPISFYLVFYGNTVQPIESTPFELYNFFVKAEPYSHMPPVLKLDQEGPVATKDLDDGGTAPCSQKIGLAYGAVGQEPSLLNDCVNVSSDPTINQVYTNKLLGGLTHDYEHFGFNVVGVNQNMTDNSLPWDKVVLDSDKPKATDTAQDWIMDVRTDSPTWNDNQNYFQWGEQEDQKGIALVYVEWANLMLQDANKQLINAGLIKPTVPPTKLGDPRCLGSNFDPTIGCTGLEGLMIPMGGVVDNNQQWVPQSIPADVNLFPANATSGWCGNGNLANDCYNLYNSYSNTTLNPGDHIAAFCDDPVNAYCPDTVPQGTSPFLTAFEHVARRLGNGVLASTNIPPEMQDRRYYYKWFAIAYVKYLRALGTMYQADITANPSHAADPSLNQALLPCGPNNPGLVNYKALGGTVGNIAKAGLCPKDVDNATIDLEALFYDNVEGATFDVFEYVDRSFMNFAGSLPNPSANQPASVNYHPWDFNYGDDLVGGNQRYTQFFQRMDREEIAMYTALLENKADPPGAESNVTLTNIFGSPVLASMYPYPPCMYAGGDPNLLGCPTNPPLEVADQTCAAGQLKVVAPSHINGYTVLCGAPAAASGTAQGVLPCSDPNLVAVSTGSGVPNPHGSGNFCVDITQTYGFCGAGDKCAAGFSCVNVDMNNAAMNGGAPNNELLCIPTTAATAADSNNTCPATQNASKQYTVAFAKPANQVACVAAYRDLNGENQSVSKQPNATAATTNFLTSPYPEPFLRRYWGAAGNGAAYGGNTVFSMGHSPIRALESDEQPGLGVTKVTIPNFLNPYFSEVPYPAGGGTGTGGCLDPWGLGDAPDPTNGNLCTPPQAADAGLAGTTVNQTASGGIEVTVPFFSLTYSAASGSGIAIPDPTPNTLRNYIYPAAQLLFNGVLESYNIWYEPFVDHVTQPSCAQGNTCATGYTCNRYDQCVDATGTIIIQGVSASDFLGELFLCEDPSTGDLLHVRMYESVQTIVNWLDAHPGTQPFQNNPESGSAQWSCGIVLRYSPYGNYLDYITSTVNGVTLQINPGMGMGRVVGAELYNPALAANATN